MGTGGEELGLLQGVGEQGVLLTPLGVPSEVQISSMGAFFCLNEIEASLRILWWESQGICLMPNALSRWDTDCSEFGVSIT